MRQKLFKNLFAIFCLTIFASSFLYGQSITGRDYYEVKGNVKMIEQKRYDAKKINNEWKRDNNDTTINMIVVIFNEQGMPLIENDFHFINYDLNFSYIYKPDFPTEMIYEYKNDKVFKMTEYQLQNLEADRIFRTTFFTKVEAKFKILESVSHSTSLPPVTKGEDTMHFSNDTIQFEWTGNRITKITQLKGGTVYNSGGYTKFVRNSNGNVIEQIIVNKKGKVSEDDVIQYFSFDKQGNWTKNIIYSKDDPSSFAQITERTITYY